MNNRISGIGPKRQSPKWEAIFFDLAGVDQVMNEKEFSNFMEQMGDSPDFTELKGLSFEKLAGEDGKISLEALKAAVIEKDFS